ncbi:MAG: ATP synthase F1 subunit delta [Nitriliruptoraceae bacterium]
MNHDQIRAYARAALAVAEAEGATDVVERELDAVARALDGSEQLRSTLTDQQLPLARRLSVVDGDLLANAHPATRTTLAMLLAAERAGELGAVVAAMRELADTGRVIAEVTVAVELDEARRTALVAALERATGRELDVRFVVDPEVVGGVRATVGDTVLDGSLLRRISELRTRVGL